MCIRDRLVDDLITLGTREPYRMFTSRAEYRLMLREDNADTRLTEKGRELGLVDDARWAAFCAKQEAIAAETARLKATWAHPGSALAVRFSELTGQELSRESHLLDLLKRPQVSYAQLAELSPPAWLDALQGDVAGQDAAGQGMSEQVVGEQIEIAVKYAGYVDRQGEEVERLRLQEGLALPSGFDYDAVKGLSNEVRQKLKDGRPETLAQAGRIPGVTPAAVSLLMITLKKQGRARHPAAQAGAV